MFVILGATEGLVKHRVVSVWIQIRAASDRCGLTLWH
ncbi:MAG: hypothetical protein QOE88_1084, partial [Verrucomicrobiota bacterium]|nr:hypothetical protein [Verrucomicrobiota bacterium]